MSLPVSIQIIIRGPNGGYMFFNLGVKGGRGCKIKKLFEKSQSPSCTYTQMCLILADILVMIASMTWCKEAKTMDMLLYKCNFQNNHPLYKYIFRSVHFSYTLKLPQRANSNVYIQRCYFNK